MSTAPGPRHLNDWRYTAPYDDEDGEPVWFYFQATGKMAVSKKLTYKGDTYFLDGDGQDADRLGDGGRLRYLSPRTAGWILSIPTSAIPKAPVRPFGMGPRGRAGRRTGRIRMICTIIT